MPALFFLSGKSWATGILASKTRLKKPTIISSQLCWSFLPRTEHNILLRLVAGYARFVFLIGEELGDGHLGVENQIKEADHHFVPTLFAPDHFLRWVRVFGIVGRIIEVRGAIDTRALG